MWVQGLWGVRAWDLQGPQSVGCAAAGCRGAWHVRGRKCRIQGDLRWGRLVSGAGGCWAMALKSGMWTAKAEPLGAQVPYSCSPPLHPHTYPRL